MRSRPSLAWLPAEETPLDTDLPQRLEHAREILTGRRIVALTGAGISTDSGIPDYRSPGAPARTPMTLSQFLSTPEFRQRYWARNHVGWRHMDAATPNASHHALTAMQRQGALAGVITQNVDMLHTKAGTRRVVELHGCYGRVRCLDCSATMSRHRLAEIMEDLNGDFTERLVGRGAIEVAPDADAILDDVDDFRVPGCIACGGTLKPDIVYFGENVAKPIVEQAFSLVDEAEALLVVGSSLTVMSGLRFARHAHRNRTPIVIINRGATRGDDIATLKIDHLCGPTLAALAHASVDTM